MKIHNWEELSKLPESETSLLEINLDMGNGYIIPKEEKTYIPSKDFMKQIKNIRIYLNTHSFYERNYKDTEKMLQACGFDVEIVSWG